MKILHFDKQVVQAHRGASGYEHQNTIKAFDKAVELKSDAIELDIRKTKDNLIVVFHDPTFEGVHINDWNYHDLLAKTEEKGFLVPLLIDVLNEYKGKILLDIEIKEEGYEEEIVKMITSVLSYDEFNIRSFSEKTIRTIKELDPNIYVILLIGAEFPKYGFFSRLAELFPKAKVRRSKCDAVSPNYQLVRLWYVQRMHLLKKAVLAWTVNDEKIMKRMLFKAKVDGIVTNYPDLAINIRDGKMK